MTARPRPRRFSRRAAVVAWSVLVAVGLAALVASAFDLGPRAVGEAGPVAISTAIAWALAVRTGGRPVIYSLLALALSVTAFVVGSDVLRTGAAVLTASGGAVLGVLATVPAVRWWQAAREATLAMLIAVIASAAAIGYEPYVAPIRYAYLVLGLALLLVFVLVYRLGAGLHGLGTRGLVMVIGGTVLLAVLIVYAEMLRRYGTATLVEALLDGRDWAEAHLGGAPRPLATLLGVPALVWGVHQRARRRQGWWACAYGVVGTATVAPLMAEEGMTWRELAITEGLALVVGALIGLVVISLDLLLTGGRGRRARAAEEEGAVRPEPARTAPLL